MTLRPFETVRVAPSRVEGRLASLAHPSTPLGMPLSRSKGQGRARIRFATAWQAVITAAFVVIGGSSSVLACPVCFGAEETSVIDGTRLGVLAMLALILAVQSGFVGFFLYLRTRAKRIAEVELDTEWSELQRPSRTS